MVKKAFQKQLTASEIIDLINKGGAEKTTQQDTILLDEPKWVHINLRMLEKQLQDISILLKKRAGMNRTQWIVEAINEKIKRDMKSLMKEESLYTF